MRVKPWVAAFLFLAFPLPIASAQNILKVPSQYKTIQAAIDAAKDKDTVLVAPGTYKECIDFKGKRIKLVSRDGPTSTIIDGQQRGSVVTFQNKEDRSTELTGFTITGGKSRLGGGVKCDDGSPTVSSNIIMGNMAGGSTWVEGGGIYVDSPALVINNVICFNAAVVDIGLPSEPSRALGGGIAAYDGELANNVLFGNRATVQTKYFGAAGGGGIYSHLTVRILNNTIFGNSAFAISKLGPMGAGGGINSGGSPLISNCIVFANRADFVPQVSALSAEYCCIEGGFPGVGNISADPRFVDPGNYDFHLRHDSPCRNQGNNAAVGLPGLDFEADPRIAGGTVDIGADEFFPHLYHTGTPTPGGTIRLKFIGTPGAQAYWGFSRYVLNPPVSIPGLQGLFHLNPSSIAIIGIGRFPSTGYIDLPFKFAPSFPKISIPMQALAGVQFTNLDVVVVK